MKVETDRKGKERRRKDTVILTMDVGEVKNWKIRKLYMDTYGHGVWNKRMAYILHTGR